MIQQKIIIIKWLTYTVSVALVVLIITKLVRYYQPALFRATTYTVLTGEVKEHDLDIIFGSDTAPLTVYMYSHYTCKFCIKFFQEDFPKLKSDYIDNGKIRFVLKLIELNRNRDVLNSLQAAVCVNKYGSFDKFHELLLSDSRVVFTQEFKDLVNDFIFNNGDIAECMLNNNNYRYIYVNNNEFMQLGLKGAPTFIVNKHIYSGYRNYHDIVKIIRNETRE